MWIAICSFLACGFLIKGGSDSALLWAMLIGAANGAVVGFALGPAAEKGAMVLSGLLAATPFYFIGTFLLMTFSIDSRKLHRHMLTDELVISSIFLVVGIAFSVAQAVRVRSHTALQPRRNLKHE